MTHDDLAVLRAELAALRTELADLRAATDPPTGRTPADARPDHRVSRRGLLAAAVAGGAGLVATQVTASPAAAAPGNPLVIGSANDGGTSVTILTSGAGVNSAALGVVNPDPTGQGIGLYAQLGAKSGVRTSGAAVIGDSHDHGGVQGLSTTAFGVSGMCETGPGVWGVSRDGSGVYGTTGSSDSAGVFGASLVGLGVHGQSSGGSGVRGESDSAVGAHGISDTGDGVYGRSTSGTGVHAYSSSGTGVQATGDSTAPGVDATSKKGYGVIATGGRAPLRLVPSTTAGAPRTGPHRAGEFYVDKTGALYFCTTDGTPGTWKKVTLG